MDLFSSEPPTESPKAYVTRGIGGHQRAFEGRSEDWLTPPHIIAALGPFDLDPCGHPNSDTANRKIILPENGLSAKWEGTVFLNPPYGPQTSLWMRKLALHGNGIALIFARTETDGFHKWIWESAHGVLFLRGRLHFHLPDGSRAPFNAGGPSCLVGYGAECSSRLASCCLAGKYVALK